jgi:hypothetical protein
MEGPTAQAENLSPLESPIFHSHFRSTVLMILNDKAGNLEFSISGIVFHFYLLPFSLGMLPDDS